MPCASSPMIIYFSSKIIPNPPVRCKTKSQHKTLFYCGLFFSEKKKPTSLKSFYILVTQPFICSHEKVRLAYYIRNPQVFEFLQICHIIQVERLVHSKEMFSTLCMKLVGYVMTEIWGFCSLTKGKILSPPLTPTPVMWKYLYFFDGIVLFGIKLWCCGNSFGLLWAGSTLSIRCGVPWNRTQCGENTVWNCMVCVSIRLTDGGNET